jgi:hypothetical protein
VLAASRASNRRKESEAVVTKKRWVACAIVTLLVAAVVGEVVYRVDIENSFLRLAAIWVPVWLTVVAFLPFKSDGKPRSRLFVRVFRLDTDEGDPGATQSTTPDQA